MSRDVQARLVGTLFQALRACNAASIEQTGAIDVSGIQGILENVMTDADTRALVMPAVALFIGFALDGTVIDITSWPVRHP